MVLELDPCHSSCCGDFARELDFNKDLQVCRKNFSNRILLGWWFVPPFLPCAATQALGVGPTRREGRLFLPVTAKQVTSNTWLQQHKCVTSRRVVGSPTRVSGCWNPGVCGAFSSAWDTASRPEPPGGQPATLASLSRPRRVGAHLAAHDLLLGQPSFTPRHPPPISPLRAPAGPVATLPLELPLSPWNFLPRWNQPQGKADRPGRQVAESSAGERTCPARRGGPGKSSLLPPARTLECIEALAGSVSHVSVSGRVLGWLLSWGRQWNAQASTGHQPCPQGEPQSRLLADLTAFLASPDRRGSLCALSYVTVHGLRSLFAAFCLVCISCAALPAGCWPP